MVYPSPPQFVHLFGLTEVKLLTLTAKRSGFSHQLSGAVTIPYESTATENMTEISQGSNVNCMSGY